MAKYKALKDYGNSQFFVRAGDVIEVDAAEADRLNRDSPGTFEEVKASGGDGAAFVAGEKPAAEDVLGERGAAVKAELEAQIPTVDLDPEDKAMEIPGEGNKYTPASGYQPPNQSGVRVVERASNRQVTSASKRGAEDEAGPVDTTSQARVTDSTPASLAADGAQLTGGVTAQAEDGEETDATAKKKKAAATDTAAQDANKGEITRADFKATKKG